MFVVRPARLDDLEGLARLARVKAPGMTTFPSDEDQLRERLEQSEKAFSGPVQLETKTNYLLLLEDLETGKIVGTSALIVGIGLDKPFYSYRIIHHTQTSKEPEVRVDTELLQLSNDFTGATEVATLFLDPDYRTEEYKPAKLGKLLAKARYLLMAAHRARFPEVVVAEIRGWVDDKGNSPFWDAIGRHFFNLDFYEADDINGAGNSQFISDLMPTFPIYTAILPEAAQEVIGRPNDGAVPAARLLEKEGFRFSGAVDIFDAGPLLDARVDLIATCRNSVEGQLAGSVEGGHADHHHLAANVTLENFRVVATSVVEGTSGLWLPDSAAEALQVGEGDTIRYVSLELDETGRTPLEGMR
ncbi:MAG: arginine N-succinyltransferase [Kordiimonadaceae bacterium]|nr:arginine N-succinyltransferase [Kordiimonadaceae bacterium]MBO6569441.1 arginine N-succinyltransferase [Kordiimonadaceae bacterium]MBO6964916.1 arginine N-succinyltransferase [Kordiimonadaceae bacterium]